MNEIKSISGMRAQTAGALFMASPQVHFDIRGVHSAGSSTRRSATYKSNGSLIKYSSEGFFRIVRHDDDGGGGAGGAFVYPNTFSIVLFTSPK